MAENEVNIRNNPRKNIDNISSKKTMEKPMEKNGSKVLSRKFSSTLVLQIEEENISNNSNCDNNNKSRDKNAERKTITGYSKITDLPKELKGESGKNNKSEKLINNNYNNNSNCNNNNGVNKTVKGGKQKFGKQQKGKFSKRNSNSEIFEILLTSKTKGTYNSGGGGGCDSGTPKKTETTTNPNKKLSQNNKKVRITKENLIFIDCNNNNNANKNNGINRKENCNSTDFSNKRKPSPLKNQQQKKQNFASSCHENSINSNGNGNGNSATENRGNVCSGTCKGASLYSSQLKLIEQEFARFKKINKVWGKRPPTTTTSSRPFERKFPTWECVPITVPVKAIPSSSIIAGVSIDSKVLTIFEELGKVKHIYPIMQCGTLVVPDSYQRSSRMDSFQIDDGFHSDGGTETPPPSPSSSSSIASTSDHGSLESVDAGGAQRLAVLSFEQVRRLNDVMNETVSIHGRGNFPTLEVTLKDLVTLVRKKLELDVQSGGAGMTVKDIRLNGGAASHVLASEPQPYNDLDLIFAVEFSSSRHYDRVKTAVLNTLLDLLPEGVSRRRIMPCSLKEAYVGKMVKVNNNNDGDRWSLISLGNSPGHKNVELKFVDTMRRQFEFSVDSFQIVLDSLLLFYDCAALPISENFYPTVVGESVYGDFQEALYHLQKKLISTRQPEEIRGGGLLKYCNLLVRNYKPVNADKIRTLERYMCSRFFIDFPDITTQTVKLEAYLRNHFWGVDEEPLQYQYLMHLRGVVETSTVCLMGHERRQTLHLIQSLAMEVLCRGQQKQQQHQQQLVSQHQQMQSNQHQQQHQSQQQSLLIVQPITAAQQQQLTQQSCQQSSQQQHQHQQQQHQLQACSSSSVSASSSQSQQQTATVQAVATVATVTAATVATASVTTVTASAQPTTTIQIQTAAPGLLYANGVYYAPVIPTTICTCNSTWLST